MKKTAVIITVTVIIIAIIGGCVTAAVLHKNDSADFEYTSAGKTASITDYAGDDKDVVVPEKIDGYTVTEIRDAFIGNTEIERVTLPSSIDDINQKMFSGCSNLKEIIFPDSIITIEAYAFEGCTSLESVTLPKNLVSIKDYAFSGCTSLKNVAVNPKLESVCSYAFNRCSSLEVFNITSDAVVYSNAFDDCASLKTIRFGGKNSAIYCGKHPVNITNQDVTVEGYVSAKTSYYMNCTPKDFCEKFDNLTFKPID